MIWQSRADQATLRDVCAFAILVEQLQISVRVILAVVLQQFECLQDTSLGTDLRFVHVSADGHDARRRWRL